jgi:hypothetical protein
MTGHYEGVCFGWRVAPENVATGDVADRKLHLDCTPKLYGSSIETSGPPWSDQLTDLDINMTAVPAGGTLEHIGKWTCGERGVSDHAVYIDGDGQTVDIERSLDAGGWLVVDAPPGSVHPCQIRRAEAVCIDAAPSYVFVLEHPTLDPPGVVLRLWSDDLDVRALVRIAERIVPA